MNYKQKYAILKIDYSRLQLYTRNSREITSLNSIKLIGQQCWRDGSAIKGREPKFAFPAPMLSGLQPPVTSSGEFWPWRRAPAHGSTFPVRHRCMHIVNLENLYNSVTPYRCGKIVIEKAPDFYYKQSLCAVVGIWTRGDWSCFVRSFFFLVHYLEQRFFF